MLASTGRADMGTANRSPTVLDVGVGLIRLTRPWNLLLFGLALFVGASTVPGDVPDIRELGKVWLAVSLIAGGGYVLNDLMDLPSDRVNRPGRPLVRRTVAPKLAVCWSCLLIVAAGITCLSLSPTCGALALLLVVMTIVYSLWAKGQPLIGNLLTALMVGLVFVLGSLVAGHGWWGLLPGSLAALIHLPLELVKDLHDLPGDRLRGLHTWPLAAGEERGRITVQIAIVLLILVLPVPVLLGWLSPRYLLLSVAGVALPAVFVAWRVRGASRPEDYAPLARVLNGCVIVGLLSLLIG